MRAQGGDLDIREVEAESEYDRYVTAVDDAAEAAVVDVLRASDVDELDWVVDPIDGTTNLVRGDSFVAVTLALLDGGRPLVGATGCPFTGELWSVARGRGAYDGSGARLAVRERPRAERRVALDPASAPPARAAGWEAAHAAAAETCAEVAPRASIALALAYVAAGIFDGFVQLGGSPVEDFAAGTLLVREAGGLVSGLDGRAEPWCADLVIAGTPKTYVELQAALESS